jgi:hypothetical protein
MGEENITFYALYNEIVKSYTIRFLNGDTVLQTSVDEYGTIPVFTGTNPTSEGMDFGGWTPTIAPVTGDMDYVAKFVAPSQTRKLVDRSITEYANPNLTNVGEYGFNSCNELKSVELLNVTSIGNYAFQYCTALMSVRLPLVPPSANQYSFAGINTACVFYIPTGSLSAYQAVTFWNSLISKHSFVEEDR